MRMTRPSGHPCVHVCLGVRFDVNATVHSSLHRKLATRRRKDYFGMNPQTSAIGILDNDDTTLERLLTAITGRARR